MGLTTPGEMLHLVILNSVTDKHIMTELQKILVNWTLPIN